MTEENIYLQTTVLWIHEFYLYKEDNEKIEVRYPSELLKQILRDKIPNCVLKKKEKKNTITTTKERLFKKGICMLEKDTFNRPSECL